MQLRMNEMQLPEKVSFNYEELKQEIAEKASFYANLVFTDDQLPEAKKTRADLNKLKKALNDERLKQEKEYMKPFNEFKAQINEIIKLIDEPVNAIGLQINNFEEQRKEEKLEKVKELFEKAVFPDWVEFERILDTKWLNKSVSIKSVEKELTEICEKIESDLVALMKLSEFSFEAIECYKDTLSINAAISEGQRLADIQKRKLEAEAKKAEQEAAPAPTMAAAIESIEQEAFETATEPPKQWVKFEALLTAEQARELRNFFNDRMIDFKAI